VFQTQPKSALTGTGVNQIVAKSLVGLSIPSGGNDFSGTNKKQNEGNTGGGQKYNSFLLNTSANAPQG